MTRKKVELVWIANSSTRRTTLKKRRKGLLKKVSELSTLCGVNACVIVYGPQESRPEVWPSMDEAAHMLSHFKSLPEMEQCKKMVDQEGFLRQRVAKLQEQLHKQKRDNRELETTLLMHQCLAGRSLQTVGVEDATSLAWMVEAKMKQVHNKMEHMTRNENRIITSQVVADATAYAGLNPHMINTMEEVTMDASQIRQNWMMQGVDLNDASLLFGNDKKMIPSYVNLNNAWLDPYFL